MLYFKHFFPLAATGSKGADRVPPLPRRHRHSLVWAAALLAVLLTGCHLRTSPVSLPLEPPPEFSQSGTADMTRRWWRSFDDPVLNRLIARALQDNFTLENIWYRLREARAIVERESSALYPSVDAQAEAEVQRDQSESGELLLLGLGSSYEVDLWGRIRAGAEAEQYRALAGRYDFETAAISLAAETGRTWFQLLAGEERLQLLRTQHDTNRRILNLISERFNHGLVRSVDILRQRQLIEATGEQILAAQADIEVTKHLLAVLLGGFPGEAFDFSGGPLPELPPLPATGMPLELVRHRPDIKKAYSLLQASDRELAAAIADTYPRLTLTGTVVFEGQGVGELFDHWIASLGAGLLAPLFDGGRRRAEVDRTTAVRNQRLAAYAQATLTAFQEVEDALIRETKQQQRLESLRKQMELARRSSDRLRSEYFNGIAEYIDILTALIEEQRLQRQLISARSELLQIRIDLYRALAGGFMPKEKTEYSSELPKKATADIP